MSLLFCFTFKMHSLMELPVFTSLHFVSRASLCHYPSKCGFYSHRFGRARFSYGNSKRCFRISMSTDGDCSEDDYGNSRGDRRAEPLFVDVIAIGSRKDAVLDFCVDSPFRSSQSLRFWSIVSKDSKNVQLQQQFLGEDLAPRSVDASLFLLSPSKTVILVASAGYGSDDITAIDILKAIGSANGFVVAIVLKPFSFEGQRRKDEVKVLLGKLKEHANFCIDIVTDMLLQKDFVTLDEALKTANNAVLLAINAISVLISEMHKKVVDGVHDNKKELSSMEVVKILERYKEAKIGFGAGNNMKASILQALYDCPFIGVGVKDINGIVICIVASSSLSNNSDVQALANSFRQTAEFEREIIISGVHEPNLEPGLLVTTIIALGCVEQQASQESNILFRLAQYFPFVFNLLRRHRSGSDDTEESNLFEKSRVPNVINLPESGSMRGKIALENVPADFDKYSEGPKTVMNSNYDDSCCSRDDDSWYDQGEAGIKSSSLNIHVSEGTPSFQRETLNCWDLGPGDQMAQEWAKERAASSSAVTVHDNLCPFHLPVGVRPENELKSGLSISTSMEVLEPRSEDVAEEDSLVSSSRQNSVPEKQGILSIRAASMLEAERESPKKWNPVMEIQYRGGVYKGRCQGGLPEGKGRLVLGDGSIYDGMWRYGKRSGPGTFYFSNGDVFQGSWRDDVMHGKGWFYFHTGDRWFANFWKGNANGESRFYSKSGNVLFGHFQKGWRHGQFLCINVDGTRTLEIWDEGVLVGREQLDSNASAG
ncbi:protein ACCUMULATION AND REPLICATION OF CHLOROPLASTS 3 isoform X2 [Tripterygium wilfordii]|uniref:protein ACCUMULATION AND REPLICATION OF CHLOROPLASTS 3 isoform X2 n=1 Tax=Tripterygium wilfordii TaxID=458696 RepID=UPI0018F857BB|nr:protein ACCUMULATION AND REPLICATION OF CHLOROPLASTS 3 isoform X2 [Tripterygium wilfordii]